MTSKSLKAVQVLKFLLLASFSSVIGRSWSVLVHYLPVYFSPGKNFVDEVTISALGKKNLLSLQVQAQKEIQHTIHEIMESPHIDCAKARVVVSALEHPKDGFASEIQYVARLLQMAVSTRRALVLTSNWKSAYEHPGCRSLSERVSGWTCLWEPLSKCQHVDSTTTVREKLSSTDEPKYEANYSLGTGILSQRQPSTSTFFDTVWYGVDRLVHAPNSFSRREDRIELRADVIPHWERVYGRYWVRAQMAHYLWRPNLELKAQIDSRLPTDIANGKLHRFIGFHIRYTDNINDLRKHFARNATLTRNFSRFMEFAEAIRKQSPENQLRDIYLATDNTEIVEESRQPRWKELGWKFTTQKDVQRSNTLERLWFQEGRGAAAGGIATDLEILKRADFLVGSFQSNVYRLACELNTAWNVNTYDFELQRHWTVDVEWYEDP